VEEGLVSFGPKVVPAPRASLRPDWFWEADMIDVGISEWCNYGKFAKESTGCDLWNSTY
jgi:hypothetical protein